MANGESSVCRNIACAEARSAEAGADADTRCGEVCESSVAHELHGHRSTCGIDGEPECAVTRRVSIQYIADSVDILEETAGTTSDKALINIELTVFNLVEKRNLLIVNSEHLLCIAVTRKSIGKGVSESASTREKVADGMQILSALTDWALEGSIITGDSMRSRGYGAGKRTSFMIYRMTAQDYFLLLLQLVLAAAVVVTAVNGGAYASFTPRWDVAPISASAVPGFLAYCAYLLIPPILHVKEDLQWYISRSRI